VVEILAPIVDNSLSSLMKSSSAGWPSINVTW
jgi:hypothetical protein